MSCYRNDIIISFNIIEEKLTSFIINPYTHLSRLRLPGCRLKFGMGFYAIYDKEGDNIVGEGKVLDLSQSFLDNLYDIHERTDDLHFMSFSIVFQSYRDNGRMIM